MRLENSPDGRRQRSSSGRDEAGSEMCIRDRCTVGARTLVDRLHQFLYVAVEAYVGVESLGAWCWSERVWIRRHRVAEREHIYALVLPKHLIVEQISGHVGHLLIALGRHLERPEAVAAIAGEVVAEAVLACGRREVGIALEGTEQWPPGHRVEAAVKRRIIIAQGDALRQVAVVGGRGPTSVDIVDPISAITGMTCHDNGPRGIGSESIHIGRAIAVDAHLIAQCRHMDSGRRQKIGCEIAHLR